MPKAILEFNLPEENEDFERAMKASDISSVLWEFDQYLRNKIKHENRNEFQEVRDKLYEIMNEYNINLD